MIDTVQHDALLDEVAETEAQIAYWQSRQLHALVAVAADPVPLPTMTEAFAKRWVREEIACELKVTSSTAEWRLSMAENLISNASGLVKLLETGQISMRYLYAFCDLTRALTDEQTQAVTDRVLDRAGEQSITNFKRSVKKAVLAVAPKTADEQEHDAIADRSVSGRESEHGVSTVFAVLPTTDQTAVMDAVENLARQWSRVESETRTLKQLRADAFVHLVCRDRDGKRRGPVINVCVALSTLIGCDDQAGELADTTVISATQARLLAMDPTSTWRRLMTDDLGRVIDYGRTTYRPPAPLAQFVKARDRLCTFPHCNRPAYDCDLDHRRDWGHDGTTCEHNLHALCERHHNAKHQAGWTPRLLANGATEWTSPIGRVYLSEPPPYPIDRTSQAPDDPPGQGPPTRPRRAIPAARDSCPQAGQT